MRKDDCVGRLVELSKRVVDVTLDQAKIVARQIEELDAKAVALLHIPYDRRAGSEISTSRHLEPQIDHGTNGVDLAALHERAADAQIAKKFVRTREDTVLADPKFGLQTDARVFSEFVEHMASRRGKLPSIINRK